MIEDKKKLTALALTIHDKLRTLKMGGTSVIPLGEHSEEDVRMYIWAYALHKNKWFGTKYDATTKVIYVERKDPASLEPVPTFIGEEEE